MSICLLAAITTISSPVQNLPQLLKMCSFPALSYGGSSSKFTEIRGDEYKQRGPSQGLLAAVLHQKRFTRENFFFSPDNNLFFPSMRTSVTIRLALALKTIYRAMPRESIASFNDCKFAVPGKIHKSLSALIFIHLLYYYYFRLLLRYV